jgi:integrase
VRTVHASHRATDRRSEADRVRLSGSADANQGTSRVGPRSARQQHLGGTPVRSRVGPAISAPVTYLRHGGADMKEIQEPLGHSTLGITADVYTSVILELQHTNADAAANLIPAIHYKLPET